MTQVQKWFVSSKFEPYVFTEDGCVASVFVPEAIYPPSNQVGASVTLTDRDDEVVLKNIRTICQLNGLEHIVCLSLCRFACTSLPRCEPQAQA